MPKRILCLVIAFLMLFSGCAAFETQNIYELLRAPKLSGGQDEIQEVLRAYLGGEEPYYVFPKKGDIRSPLTWIDLNGDGKTEVILLYTMPDGTEAHSEKGNNVYIAVLQEIEGEWQVVVDAPGPPNFTEVESMEISNLLHDDTRQMIIGFATSNFNTKMFGLYTYEQDVLENLYMMEYSSYAIGEFTQVGSADLVVVSASDQLEGMQLYYIPTEDGEFSPDRSLEQVQLDDIFIACVGIHASRGEDGERIIVVDGETAAGTLASQIVYYSGERFFTVDNSTTLRGPTTRMNPLLHTKDINSDGVAEIPIAIGSEYIMTPAADKQLTYIGWMDFVTDPDQAPVQKEFGLLDSDRNVYISLPSEWQGEVSILDGEDEGEWILQERNTRKELMYVDEFGEGDVLPLGAERIPGSVNNYLVMQSTVTSSERQEIEMTFMGIT